MNWTFPRCRRLQQAQVEVEFLSVTKNSSLGYGLSLPTSAPLVNFGMPLNGPAVVPSGFTRFLTFGGGATLLGMGITDAAAFATLSRGSSSSVLTSQVVTLDGQSASLHVGDRYPIITNGYIGQAGQTGQVFTPPPTVNFEDLGLVLKITPSVHQGGDVTLDVDAEFKVLGTIVTNGIPTISNRKYQGKVRLASGEWAVVAGLLHTDIAETQSGIPGLSKLFGTNTRDRDSAEVLLVLKPHLVNLPPWETPARPFWVGSESKPLSTF